MLLWDRAAAICKPEFANILQSLDNNITPHYKQCQVRDIRQCRIPQGNFCWSIKTHPDMAGNTQLPFTFLSFNHFFLMMPGCHLWLSPPPASRHLGLAQNPACFSILLPSPPALFIKPKHSPSLSLLLLGCKIISFLLAVTEAILPPEIHSKCKNHFFWITASSTLPLFHPASPPTGSPFFYYIKHKLLALILRVVLR